MPSYGPSQPSHALVRPSMPSCPPHALACPRTALDALAFNEAPHDLRRGV